MFPVVLSTGTAWILSAFIAFSYVASVYTLKAGRLVFTAQQVEVGQGAERARAANERWRNDPSTIKARLLGVVMSTITSCLLLMITVYLTSRAGISYALKETITILGLNIPLHVPLGAWLLAPVLYTGPLYVQLVEGEMPFQQNWSVATKVAPIFTNWLEFRNIIAAPITEELVFRSCIVALMQLSGSSFRQIVFLSPLWFGAAHLHHGWDLYNRFGKTKRALQRAALTIAFQLTYTTLFGWFEAYILVRTGSIYPCIFAHSFCNIYGLPLPTSELRRNPKRKIDIALAYLIGIVAFTLFLSPWTQT